LVNAVANALTNGLVDWTIKTMPAASTASRIDLTQYASLPTGTAGLFDLSRDPATAWVVQVAKRDDVTWRAVQEAHQSWNYSSQGLSGAAAAVIAIAVAIATQGAGAGLLAAAGGLGGALGGAVADAAISSLISQASVSLINNRGNIGKVLQELGSVESLKNLAITMAAAGAFYQVGTWTDGHFNDGTVLGENGRALSPVERADQYLGTANHAANIAGHAVVGGTEPAWKIRTG